ncbi:MAG: hypothetical protein V4480_00970 [Patescibacteria group bacterium]
MPNLSKILDLLFLLLVPILVCINIAQVFAPASWLILFVLPVALGAVIGHSWFYIAMAMVAELVIVYCAGIVAMVALRENQRA